MGNRTPCWIGFIFADDPKCLHPSVRAPDTYGAAEAHLRRIRRIGNHASAGTAGAPVTQVTGCVCHSVPVLRSQGGGMSLSRLIQHCLEIYQALLRDIVRVCGNVPVGQSLQHLSIFPHKRSAHSWAPRTYAGYDFFFGTFFPFFRALDRPIAIACFRLLTLPPLPPGPLFALPRL